MHTGNLVFLHYDELFIICCLKDLIVARYQNYYSQDIELTV